MADNERQRFRNGYDAGAARVQKALEGILVGGPVNPATLQGWYSGIQAALEQAARLTKKEAAAFDATHLQHTSPCEWHAPRPGREIGTPGYLRGVYPVPFSWTFVETSAEEVSRG